MQLAPPPLRSLAQPLPKDHLRSHIPGGEAGTVATIRRMQELVTAGKRDFRKRGIAGRIIRGETVAGIPWRGNRCPNKNYYCYAQNIYLFTRDGMQYAYDPAGVELVEHPLKLLESRIGDCDSLDILFATLCENIGLPVVFVTIKADRMRPAEFSHVYCRVRIPKHGWVAADPTIPNKHFGWEPPKRFPRRLWPASLDPPDVGGGIPMIKGIAEGPVPGVRRVGPDRAGPGTDISILPNPGGACCNGAMGGFGEAPGKIEIARGILNGSVHRKLLAMQRDQMRQNGRINGDMWVALRNMPDGPEKQRATAKWREAVAENRLADQALRASIDFYNQVARAARLAGVAQPPLLSGLGFFATAAAVTALVAVASFAISKLIDSLSALTGHQINTKGYMEQFADIVKAGGGVLHETSSLLRTVAITAGVGVAAYLGYRVLESRGVIGGAR